MGEVPDREDDEGGGVEGVEGGGEDLADDDGHVVEAREPESAAPRLPLLDPAALGEILEFLARALVENPDGVRVEMEQREGGVTLRLSVDQPDMGKVIGRAGRTARALRTMMRAAGVRAGVTTHVEIVEQEGSGG